MAAKKDTKTTAADEAEAIHDKREAYDNPPADPPVPIVDTVGEVETDKKADLVFELEGSQVKVSIGKTSVLLDREGVFGAQRHLNKFASQL